MGQKYKINIITDTQKKCPEKTLLISAAQKALQLEGIKNDVSLNILLTDNSKIKDLNRQFLNRNEATDVLAFGAKGLAFKSRSLKGFIGEIVISVEMAEHNARLFDSQKEKEIFLYVIHGILHLLGYADKTKRQIKIIQDRQSGILEAICGRTKL
jgi:probable rRNA maturation factor